MSPAVDHRILDQLHAALGGDTPALRRIIEAYFSCLPGRLAALHGATSDLGQLCRAAHGLASPSVTLGVRAMAEPCLALERALEDGKPSTEFIATHLATIDGAVGPSSAGLHAWLASKES